MVELEERDDDGLGVVVFIFFFAHFLVQDYGDLWCVGWVRDGRSSDCFSCITLLFFGWCDMMGLISSDYLSSNHSCVFVSNNLRLSASNRLE